MSAPASYSFCYCPFEMRMEDRDSGIAAIYMMQSLITEVHLHTHIIIHNRSFDRNIFPTIVAPRKR